jgi:carbamoyl-phosphate synthase large subunit
MAKREDIRKILIIGSGPIIIGQACEFDYSGTQACKALRAEGYDVVLVNSNPATIMTDPGMADHTYIEPLTVDRITAVIEKERPDALLPNLGGQTALNLASKLHEEGILKQYGVEVIGVDLEAIARGEDRIIFKETMDRIGVPVAKSEPVYSVEEAEKVAAELGYPVVLRPAYTMGGTGGGIVYNVEELRQVVPRGLAASLINQVLVEECVLGWEELELEVVRDAKGQKITVCFIENVDPMGVHTGDSFCVAPMLTVPQEVQDKLQDYSYRILDAIGVTGGTNVKFARWAFEKFPKAADKLGTQMKAVGEVMSIGQNFKEAFQKAVRSLEIGRAGLGRVKKLEALSTPELREKITYGNSERFFQIYELLRRGVAVEEIVKLTRITPYFIEQMKELADFDFSLDGQDWDSLSAETLRQAKEMGFSDKYLAQIFGVPEKAVRARRQKDGITATFRIVPVSGVEHAEYYYSTYSGAADEVPVNDKKKIMILGGGPNRIGQGIEFDYTCVHAAFTLRDHGYESIMVNCNPETVSTDFDTANKLYFEPVTVEDVLAIYEKEKPEGVIVQFGGQTPLNIAQALKDAGVKIMGTQPEGIRLAEDREYFRERMIALNIRQPESGTARSLEEAVELGRRIGYPVMVRPSFVLGGRGMEVIYDEENLKRYGVEAIQVSPEYPMLIDRFLDNAIEAEVDALADGTDTFVATVMEHIELAGIHSGDSACAIPPVTIAPKHIRTIEEHAAKIAQDFQVKGILNVQFAICNDEVYIIEANPRASRTVPIVSKVTGISLARYATEIMLGKKLKELGLKSRACRFIGVKEAVFPFNMFPEVDPVLGPEMRATGEVMGIADNFGMAYYKAQEAAGCILPTSGKVLVTVSDRDKKFIEPIARDLISLGFTIISTGGTAEYLRGQGVETEVVNKLHEGRPNLGDMITNKQIDLIINTPVDRTSMIDDSFIRMQSIQKKIPYMTTIAAARATVEGIRSAQHVKVSPRSLQEYHS